MFEDQDKNSQAHDERASQNHLTISRSVPPTLLRIYADNQDKRTMCIFWALFFIVLIVMTAASAGLPQETISFTNEQQLKGSSLQKCSTSPIIMDGSQEIVCANQSSTQYGIIMPNLSPQNQFGVISLRLMLENSKQKQDFTEEKVICKFYVIEGTNQNDDLVHYKKVSENDSQELNITLHSEQSTAIYAEDDTTVKGYSYPVWVVRKFQEKSYLVTMQFSKKLTEYDNVESVEAVSFAVNKQFTIYTIVIRYFFFVWSILGFVLYLIRFRIIPKGYKIPEQKMVLAMSILLIFFNDPIYPATVLTGNKAASYFSVFFVMTFVIYLLFFWMFFLDRIFYEDGQKQSKLMNWKRVLYILLTYIISLVLYTEYAFDNLEGMPLVPAEDLFATKFKALEIITIILVLVGFIYIIVQYARICMQVDEKLWRNQLFMFFSIFFIFISIVMFFVNGYRVFSYTGNRILLLFTQANMYTFYMQYMYSVTAEEKTRIERGQLLEDNNELFEQQNELLSGGYPAASQKDCVDLQFDELPSGIMNRSGMKRDQSSWRNSRMSNRGRKELVKNQEQKKQNNSDDEQPQELVIQKKEEIDFFKQQEEPKKAQKKEEDGGFGNFDLE